MSLPAVNHLSSPLLAEFAAREARMLEDVRTTVNIPTGPGSGNGLAELRGWFAERLSAMGARTHEVVGTPAPEWLGAEGATPHCPPTLICHKHNHNSPRVLLCGHLDTVHPAHVPFNTLTISPTTATGPGAVDMKAGLIIALHALEALHTCGYDISWGFILNSDEETGSYASAQALDAEARNGYVAGLVYEPAMADGGLVVSRPGSGQFKIECHGKAGHVGRDFATCVSAVTALGHCINRVAAMADPKNGAIVNIGPLSGGTATNIVPDHAAAWGNVRFTDANIAERLAEQLESLATFIPTDAAGLPKVTLQRSFHRPAKPLVPATQQLAELAQNCALALGQRLPFGTTGGVCDGNNLQHAGLPTIDTLGARGGGLHTTSEWIEIVSLRERAELSALLILNLVSKQ